MHFQRRKWRYDNKNTLCQSFYCVNENKQMDVKCRNFSLGFTTKARACKVVGQEGSLRVKESVREWTLTLPKELSLWEVEFRWTLECLERDYKGQNPMAWKVIYTIGKILKCQCLKWAHMTHLDIWNTSYGQKKGRVSNWQFDS